MVTHVRFGVKGSPYLFLTVIGTWVRMVFAEKAPFRRENSNFRKVGVSFRFGYLGWPSILNIIPYS